VKRFRFSLHALRTLRQRQEQAALEQFARAIAAREQAARELAEVCQHCETAWHIAREAAERGVAAARLTQLGAYCHAVEELRRQGEDGLRRAQQAVDEKWQTLMAARRDREAVDKYRQRQQTRHGQEWVREEQKTLDDIAHRQPRTAAARRMNSLLEVG
jgi:flagellar export protein FliJ